MGYNSRMNGKTIEQLNQLNNDFYQANFDSFDRSRQSAWPGWKRIGKHLAAVCDDGPLQLLDVGCGNLRFERFLAKAMPETAVRATCVDSCRPLVKPLQGCTFVEEDVVVRLLAGEKGIFRHQDTCHEAVVSFGFFHHVPSFELRCRLIRELVAATRPGGIVAATFWRFASDSAKRTKAELTTRQAVESLDGMLDLEDRDYLLGWNNQPGAYRYCHSFDEAEVDALVSEAATHAETVDRFLADGRTNDMNEYAVLRRL